MIPASTNQLLAAGFGYQISRSVRLRSSASAFFSRSAYPVSGAGTRWTMSKWVKRGNLSTANDLFSFVSTTGSALQAGIQFDTNGAIRWWQYAAPSYHFHKVTTAVFRDPSAWYHLVFIYDTTLATAEDRLQVWVNGVRQTAFSTNVNPVQNLVTYYSNGSLYPYIGAENRNGSSAVAPFDGYLTEINFIDGLTPNTTTRTVGGVTQTVLAELGEFDAVTGVWKPARWTRTYGTNGFYLNFSDPSAATAAAIGKDYSGNGNNWTPNNISVTAGATYDSMLDVPTLWADGGNGRGNYAVLNPLLASVNNAVLSNANLTATLTFSSQVNAFSNTPLPTTGKWYWETTVVSNSLGVNVGIRSTINASLITVAGIGAYSYYNANGNKYDGATASAYGTAWFGASRTDVIGVAYDADTRELSFYLNGVSQGVAFTVAVGEYYPAASHVSGSGSHTEHWNFGQRPFAYTPPTGFRALNTQNLPVPTILKGNQFFDATLYTGNGSTQSVANSGGFAPDLVWIKSRSNGYVHRLADTARGATLYSLVTNTADVEAGPILNSINPDGFTTNGWYEVGGSIGGTGLNVTFVGWQWKEGATQGFDIVTYTGNSTASRSISHSLGVTPAMIIVKNRSAVQNWPVAHTSLTVGNLLTMDTTQATVAGGTRLRLGNSTAFTVGDAADYGITNQTGNNYVAYLFAEVAGFSRFGSYTGNGSADGPFVFCGFRPRWILIKRSSTFTAGFGDWYLYDTARMPINVTNTPLYPNTSAAESGANSSFNIDILSNGFKVLTTYQDLNLSGTVYIFAAFAENPFKYSLAR